MFHFFAIVFAVALQGAAGAPSVPVRADCDASSDIVAQVPRDAAFRVTSAIDNAPTCYSVSVNTQGKQFRGYVIDAKLDAVVAFENARVANEREAFKMPLPLPASAAPPAPKEAEKSQPVVAASKSAPEKKKPRKDVAM